MLSVNYTESDNGLNYIAIRPPYLSIRHTNAHCTFLAVNLRWILCILCFINIKFARTWNRWCKWQPKCMPSNLHRWTHRCSNMYARQWVSRLARPYKMPLVYHSIVQQHGCRDQTSKWIFIRAHCFAFWCVMKHSFIHPLYSKKSATHTLAHILTYDGEEKINSESQAALR